MAKESDNYLLQNVRIRLVVSESDNLYSNENIGSPKEAVSVMGELLSTLDREYVCVVNLDSKNRPINYNLVSVGDISHAYVPMQNVFKSAILSNACSIMLFHSHPSGDCSPSKEDYSITEKVIQAGKLMNIPVVDHIIIGGGSGEHYSFKENNYGLFDEPINKEKIKEIVASQAREETKRELENEKVAEKKTRRKSNVRH